ncbi:MAG: hypothetical protein H0X13_09395 [Ramlibacter sp.]|nr:hypothetical protein [Ramlibacter sp.]
MLADGSNFRPFGKIADGVLEEGHSRTAILDFVLGQLPMWRDRSDRPARTSETTLTSQLCAHLNSAARKSSGLDCLQFRVEEADETESSRKIDLVAAPAGGSLIVEGRSYVDFDSILPIECKRLPVPAGSGRDPREYVATSTGMSGGIQRYKAGKHGAAHGQAGLIAYVQAKNFDHWFSEIETWIKDLHAARSPGWSMADLLVKQALDAAAGMAVHNSVHSRIKLPAIHIRHMWIKMNS